MRIRQIKPAFWTDSKIGRLPVDARLFTIGTWLLADDAGWLEWNVPEIGAALYPYDPAPERESRIQDMGTALVDLGLLVVYTCGHAHVPHLVEHQRLAGPTRRVETTHRRHLNDCPASPRGFPRIPDPVRLGKERSGTVREPAETAGLRSLVQIDQETGTYIYVAPEGEA